MCTKQNERFIESAYEVIETLELELEKNKKAIMKLAEKNTERLNELYDMSEFLQKKVLDLTDLINELK